MQVGNGVGQEEGMGPDGGNKVGRGADEGMGWSQPGFLLNFLAFSTKCHFSINVSSGD